jgi:TonB family protein
MRAQAKPAKFHAPVKLPSPRLQALEGPAIEAPAVIVSAPPIPAAVAQIAPNPPAPARRTALIETDVFSSSAPTARINAVAKVQTGGFSGASTVPTQSGRSAQIASAGFGEAGVERTGSGAGRPVGTGGFGDAAAAAPMTGAGGSRPAAPHPVTAAQILDKPRPAYTDEARRMKIEGEVQLEVLFRASGEVDILRVVRGLGHGLDENAAQAARTIRFLPAKREGRPVDSTATVHIIFQLAS